MAAINKTDLLHQTWRQRVGSIFKRNGNSYKILATQGRSQSIDEFEERTLWSPDIQKTRKYSSTCQLYKSELAAENNWLCRGSEVELVNSITAVRKISRRGGVGELEMQRDIETLKFNTRTKVLQEYELLPMYIVS